MSTHDRERRPPETFQALAEALTRHATLASVLRAAGWKLAAYTA